MPVRKIAKVVNAAMRDAGRARTHAGDPEFRKNVQKDRRGELSKFKTVRDALADRDKIERTRGGTKNKK